MIELRPSRPLGLFLRRIYESIHLTDWTLGILNPNLWCPETPPRQFDELTAGFWFRDVERPLEKIYRISPLAGGVVFPLPESIVNRKRRIPIFAPRAAARFRWLPAGIKPLAQSGDRHSLLGLTDAHKRSPFRLNGIRS
jgi:hypothetical protein